MSAFNPTKILISAASIIAMAGCAGMLKQQQEEEARRAQHDAFVREARSACYEGVKRDDLAGIVYDVLVGRRYDIDVAMRGIVSTKWLNNASTRSKVNVRVEEGRVETCRVVTLTVAAEVEDSSGGGATYGNVGSGNWIPGAADVARAIEDDLYTDIHAKAKSMAPASATPPKPSEPTLSTGQQGAEGVACYGNGTCDTGLTCASNLCVKLPK